ncbi:MAG: LysO family transporter [Leptospirales bacterium]|nr:LysO family transporter [Leptospirales bacterium]
MTEILIIMFSGIALGFIIRKKRYVIMLFDKLTSFSIYLLLFLLGLSIGNNEIIINQFGRIGINAILLAFSGIVGSVMLSYFVYKFFKREEKEDRER